MVSEVMLWSIVYGPAVSITPWSFPVASPLLYKMLFANTLFLPQKTSPYSPFFTDMFSSTTTFWGFVVELL